MELFIRLAISVTILVLVLIILIIVLLVKRGKEHHVYNRDVEMTPVEKYNPVQPDLNVQLLTVNEYSRPGIALDEVNGIVVHWTANPGTSAIANRDYFEGLSISGETHASSHFVIGLDGEIVQCIPCNEIAYASNDRNYDTVSIECCIEDETGAFNDATYQTLIELVTWLMGRYELTSDAVIRHYDVTGKDCPRFYCPDENGNQEAWDQFHADLDSYIEQYGIVRGGKEDRLLNSDEE